MVNEHNLKIKALLSIQRALLGEISSEMKAISVTISNALIKLRVYYEGVITEDLTEEFDASVITELVSDFPEPKPDGNDPVIEFEFLNCKFSSESVNGELVYLRK